MTALKFPALAVGQRFRLRGNVYVKTSPVLARAEDSGHSQMIPRSALVEPLDAPPASGTETSLSANAVVDELHAAAQACLESLAKSCAASKPALNQARNRLRQACRDALARLGQDR